MKGTIALVAEMFEVGTRLALGSVTPAVVALVVLVVADSTSFVMLEDTWLIGVVEV